MKHKHHIVPRHAGGTDDPSNLVLLTPTEHAQAHLDRFNKLGDVNDALAYNFLIYNIDKFGNFLSGFSGKKHSEKSKEKMSKTRKGKYSGNNNPMFGKTGKKCPVSISVKFENIIFESITALAIFLKQPKRTIANRIKNNPQKWGYEVIN